MVLIYFGLWTPVDKIFRDSSHWLYRTSKSADTHHNSEVILLQLLTTDVNWIYSLKIGFMWKLKRQKGFSSSIKQKEVELVKFLILIAKITHIVFKLNCLKE